MKAYLLNKTGKPETLKVKQVAEPSPRENEVKIKIEFIGLNYAEVLSRRGQYQWAPKKPYIPGMEAVGEIVEIGSEVKNSKVGDKVICGGQYGTYAEYICVSEHMTFPVIQQLTMEQNAAFLVNYMTAWIALVELGRISKGNNVLIHAAAGGVGTAAVQLAKALQATVFGTASRQDKLDLISSLGADHAINYASEDFEKYIRSKTDGVDMVLEVVGGEVFKKSVNLLNPFGRVVVIGYASIPFKKWNPITWYQTWKNAPKVDVMNLAINSQGVLASHIGYLIKNQKLARGLWDKLSSFISKHEIKPVVGRVFDFHEMPEAHGWIESRNSTGKVIVRIKN